MALSIEQFGATIKAKYPQYADLSDREIGSRMLSKYPQYRDMVQTYDAPENRQNKISQAQLDASTAQREARQANSVGGFLGNFGSALVSNLAPSEVGLGETIRKSMFNQSGQYASSIDSLTSAQVSAAKKIREMESQGKDATKLKQIYMENERQLESLRSGLTSETQLPTNTQALGQVGGTALDVLTAGTYGRAATGLQTGRLSMGKSVIQKIATPVPVVGQIGQLSATTPGLFTKQGAARVLAGGAIGYGYDVTQGLQGLRGDDRTGTNAFIPGLGTATGALAPIVTGAIQTAKNASANRAAGLSEDIASKLTKPKLTTAEKARAIANRRLMDPKILEKGRLRQTAYDESVANSIRPYVKNQDVARNIEAIAEQVSIKDSQIGQHIAQNNKTFTEGTLRDRLNRGSEDLNVLFASEPTAKKTYQAVVKEFIRNLQSNDTLGLFRTRQDFDNLPAIEKLLNNDKLSANLRREIVLAVRAAANSFIDELLGKNNPYKYVMEEQSLMMEAINRIAANNTHLLDNSKIDLIVRRFPILKYAVGGALGAAGVGVGGAAISSL